MAFPMTPLDQLTEIYVSGAWRDITTDVRGSSGVEITRGRANEQQRVMHGTCSLTLNNRDGVYSPRNANSELYGLIGHNTQLRHAIQPHFSTGTHADVTDSFTRSESNGWGTATSGQSWTIGLGSGGSVLNSDWNVSGTEGTHGIPAANAWRASYLDDLDCKDVNAVVTFKVAQATGGSLEAGLYVRGHDGGRTYVRFELNTSNAVVLAVQKLTGSDTVSSTLGTATVSGLAHTGTGQPLRLRVRTVGRRIYARVWIASGSEPTSWHLSVTDTDAAVAGWVGIRSGAFTGNSNAKPVTFSYDSLEIVPELPQCVVEVPAWPQEWDTSGTDFYVPLDGSGILRRLSQGSRALKSPMVRSTLSPENADSVIGYWTCEDIGDSTIGSGLPGGPDMRILGGSVSSATSENLVGASSLLSFGTGTTAVLHSALTGTVDTDSIKFTMLMEFPAGGLAGTERLVDLYTYAGSGSIRLWRLQYETASSGSLRLTGLDSTFSTVEDSGALSNEVNGKSMLVYFTVEQNGADVDWTVGTTTANADGSRNTVDTGATFTAQTVGRVHEVYIGPDQGLEDVKAGHFTIANSTTVLAELDDALTGFAGETAIDRISRLAGEFGVTFKSITAVSGIDDSAEVGPQRTVTFIDSLHDAAEADGGILFESRDELGLTYRSRASLYNQTGVALDYALNHLSPPLRPTDDDQLLRNRVEVTRYNGKSHIAEKTTGPLNTGDPTVDPQAAGLYEYPVSLLLSKDTQVPDMANWLLHVGTVDEPRWPQVRVELHRDVFVDSNSLTLQAAIADIGDYSSIDNVPTVAAVDLVELIIQGSRVRTTNYTWEITWNNTPASPYRVAELDDDVLGKLDTAGCEVASAFTAGGTSLLVNTAENHSSPRYWTTDSGEYPFDIRSEGAVLTATACAPGLTDAFGRVTASGWGTPLTSYPGTAYQTSGTAADFSTTGALGRIATVTVNSLYLAHADTGATDGDLVGSVTVPVVPTGAAITVWLAGRLTDASNYYVAHLNFATTGVVTLSIGKRVAGVFGGLVSVSFATTHSAGDTWKARLKWTGTTLRARAWKSTATEPAYWQLMTTDTDLTVGKRIGAGVRREAGNTNGTQNIDFDNFELYNPQIFTVSATSANGVSKNLAEGDAVNLAYPAALAL